MKANLKSLRNQGYTLAMYNLIKYLFEHNEQ